MWKTVVYSPNTGAEVISIENQHCLALVSTTDGAYYQCTLPKTIS